MDRESRFFGLALLVLGAGGFLFFLDLKEPWRTPWVYSVLTASTIVVGILLLRRIRWAPEIFLLLILVYGTLAAYQWVTEEFTIGRLSAVLLAIPLAFISYPTIRGEIRGTKEVQLAGGVAIAPSGVRVTPETPLEIGMQVLVLWEGRWWRAEVIGLEDDSQVRVRHDGTEAVVSREVLELDVAPERML